MHGMIGADNIIDEYGIIVEKTAQWSVKNQEQSNVSLQH